MTRPGISSLVYRGRGLPEKVQASTASAHIMAMRSSGVVLALRSSEGSSPKRNTFTGQEARARRRASTALSCGNTVLDYTVAPALRMREVLAFGALRQMLGGLSGFEKAEAWAEIEETVRQFEGAAGFEGPCELVAVAGTKSPGDDVKWCTVRVLYRAGVLAVAVLVGPFGDVAAGGQPEQVPAVEVSPFDDVTGRDGDAWLGAGIAESVRSDLSQLGGVRVLSHATGERSAGTADPAAAHAIGIGQDPAATLLVTGGYQHVGDRLRITARVSDVATGRVVDTVKVDGPFDTLFALQDRIVVELAAALTGASPEAAPDGPRDVRRPAGATSQPPPAATAAAIAAAAPPASPADAVTSGTAPAGFGTPGGISPPPPVAPAVISRDNAGHATVRAVRVSEPIRLDGLLDERVYQTVAPFGDFIQAEPDAGAVATERTDAWVLFDDENVYVTARMWDSAPESRWVANEMRRDSRAVLQNETISFFFDTFFDRRNGLAFSVTPIGGRMDGQTTNEGNYNGDYNLIWDLQTGRFEGGWTLEAALPFKSLRYRPGRQQVWGLQMRRIVRWKNEMSFLTQIDPGVGRPGIFQASRAATLVGLEAPEGGRTLEIKPYLITDLTSERAATSGLTNQLAGNVGIDVLKYGLTDSLSADLTVNTDFAQAEADEQQVNLTRFSLFFPEKREFFLENQGVFAFGGGRTSGGRGGGRGGASDTPILFHSRRIGLAGGQEVPITAGGRLTGRAGNFDLGLLNIQTGDAPDSAVRSTNFTVARLKRDVLRRGSIGALVTNRSRSASGAGSDQTWGLDGGLAFFDNLAINTYWARARTTGDAGRTSYRGELNYNGDRYGVRAEHLFIDEGFSPGIGFVRRADLRKSSGALRFSPRPQSIAAIRKLTGEGAFDYITDAAGFVETREALGRFEVEFENTDIAQVSVTDTFDFLKAPFRIAPDITIPVGGYAYRNAEASLTLGTQRRLAGTVGVEHGTFFGGEKTAVSIGQSRVELTSQFSFEPSVSFNWVDLPQGRFTTRLVTTRTTYTISPLMFVSALVQYNSSNNAISSNIRLRWEYRPGSELFVVYNEQRDTLVPGTFPALENRTFVIKLNRLFRY